MAYWQLIAEDRFLEQAIMETIKTKLDRDGGDVQGAARALMRMFEIKLRGAPVMLRCECYECKGLGKFIMPDEPKEGVLDYSRISERRCTKCKYGVIESEF